MRRYWTCRKCKYRQERTASRRCLSCGGLTKPKRRVPKHAEVLRDTSYEASVQLSYAIHGQAVELGACGVCGRLPSEARPKHDRDHDHRTGQLRGLACWRCNRELLRGHTVETLRACLEYLERAERYHREAA